MIPSVAATFPVHDPPIAWREHKSGIDLIVCPSIPADGNIYIGELPAWIPVLDHEPGRPLFGGILSLPQPDIEPLTPEKFEEQIRRTRTQFWNRVMLP